MVPHVAPAHAYFEFRSFPSALRGTVPFRVERVTCVSGHVTSSGRAPRISTNRTVRARSRFQSAVASGVSVTLPPYSRPSGLVFGEPTSHWGWISRLSSTFFLLGLPRL